MNEQIKEYFVAIDMDRTLFAPDRLAPFLYDIFNLSEQEASEALGEQRANTGKSFDTYGYLVRRFGERVKTDQIIEQLIDRNGVPLLRDTVLMPGAKEILEVLGKKEVEHGVLTTGNTFFQTLKFRLLTILLNNPPLNVMVTDTANKSELVANDWWRGGKKAFVIPEGIHGHKAVMLARNIVIIDDKQSNLTYRHPNIYPIHVGETTVLDLAHDLGSTPLKQLLSKYSKVDNRSIS